MVRIIQNEIKHDKKICVTVNGCHESRNDAARMQKIFIKNGWIVTNDFKDADIIFFKACGLVNDLHIESIETIKRLKTHKKPSAELIVYGCLPKIDKDLLRKVYKGLTFGSDEYESGIFFDNWVPLPSAR